MPEQLSTEKALWAAIWLLALVPLMLLYAFTLQMLWFWFVIPVFKVPPLMLGQALGLSLFIGWMRSSWMHDPDADRGSGEKLMFRFVKPAVFLIMGWLINAIFAS